MKTKILVSACLCGEACRYNGQAVPFDHPVLERWLREGRVVAFCPELLGGLPVPRGESQRRGSRVVTREGADVTEAFTRGAQASVDLARTSDAAFCLLKQRSPSCGTRIIHDGTFAGVLIPGEGLAAQALREAGFVLFGEDEMDKADAYDQALREETDHASTDR
jgi:uncharacterized protein YbbK (DUF523 family)